MLNPIPTNTAEPEQIDIRQLSDNEFLRQCEPSLSALEQIRLAKQKIYELRKKIALPIVFIGTPLCGYIDYWLLLLQSNNDESGAGITFAFLGALYWWVSKPKREYAKEYKKEILPRILKLFGCFTYNPDGTVDLKELENSKIIPSYNGQKSEDYFCGAYKDIKIEFCETKLTKTTGSGKNRRTKRVFKGLVILLEMKRKKFYGITLLNRNQNKMGQWMKERSLDLKRANMVDPNFEKIYDAYTNDQVEARYLLDPVIIERYNYLYQYYAESEKRDKRSKDPSWIEKFKKADNLLNIGKGISVSYFDNKVLIMIANNFNYFEPADIHVLATNPETILHMKQEIGDILSLADQLDLYDPKAVHD